MHYRILIPKELSFLAPNDCAKFIKFDSKLRPQERWQTDRQTDRQTDGRQRSYKLSHASNGTDKETFRCVIRFRFCWYLWTDSMCSLSSACAIEGITDSSESRQENYISNCCGRLHCWTDSVASRVLNNTELWMLTICHLYCTLPVFICISAHYKYVMMMMMMMMLKAKMLLMCGTRENCV